MKLVFLFLPSLPLRRLTRPGAGFCLLLAAGLLAGCMPVQQGANQIVDINVVATANKDAIWDDISWPEVDDVMAQYMAQHNIRGCAVGVVQNDQITYLKGYGLAHSPGVPYTTATVGGLGSVSKTLTALAIHAAVEDGLIGSVDDPARDYLPDWHPDWVHDNGDDITIADLLNHQADFSWNGTLNDLPSDAALAAQFGVTWPGLHPRTVASGLAQEVMGQPIVDHVAVNGFVGILAKANYMNVHYMLLGGILDEVTQGNAAVDGIGYEQYVWRQVGNYAYDSNDPDQMWSLALYANLRAGDIPNLSTQYDAAGAVTNGFTVDGPDGWPHAAGGWVSTIGDLARLIIAINDHRIVPEAATDQMFDLKSSLINRGGLKYGQGGIVTSLGSPFLRRWHGGNIGGWSALWALHPTTGDDLGIALQCNRAGLGFTELLDGDEFIDVLALAIGGSDPEPAPVGQEGTSPAPVPAAELDGQVYEIDPREGRVAGLPPTVTALLPAKLLLAVEDTGRGTLAFTLAHAKPAGTQNLCVPTTRFAGVDYTGNPRFSGSAGSLSIATAAGPVASSGAKVSGTVQLAGDALALSLGGTLDLRDLVPLTGLPASLACSQSAAQGRPCKPCADQSPTCLPWTLAGLKGKAVATTVQPVTASCPG